MAVGKRSPHVLPIEEAMDEVEGRIRERQRERERERERQRETEREGEGEGEGEEEREFGRDTLTCPPDTGLAC